MGANAWIAKEQFELKGAGGGRERTLFPAGVWRKREFFTVARRLSVIWRVTGRNRQRETLLNANQARRLRAFLSLQGDLPNARTAWLGWENSNFDTTERLVRSRLSDRDSNRQRDGSLKHLKWLPLGTVLIRRSTKLWR